MRRVIALLAGVAALTSSQPSPKLRMAVGEAGITMDDAACRKTNRATTGESTAVTTTRIADRGFGLILAAGTSRDTLRRIRLLRPSTTARRLTQFRTAYVSRTQDLVRPDCWRTANSFGGSLVPRPTKTKDSVAPVAGRDADCFMTSSLPPSSPPHEFQA
jgi:hypothetical protein